jgi:predicted phosphodiesterase
VWLPDRIGVIGDVHGEIDLLERALEHLSATDIEVVLCTGDIADGIGSVPRCCELLEYHNVVVVRGNHDRWWLTGACRHLAEATPASELTDELRGFLTSLPATVEFESALGPVLLCHGLGENDMAKVGPDDTGYALESNVDLQRLIHEARYCLVVNGHTHRAMLRRFATLMILNAGTLKRDDDPCFLRVDLGGRTATILGFADEGTIEVRDSMDLY